MFRQGDLLIIPISKVPINAELRTDNILALGEATGHKHQLIGNGQISGKQSGIQYVEIVEPSKIVHEEHKEISLDKGSYVIIHQREYDPFAQMTRRVMD